MQIDTHIDCEPFHRLGRSCTLLFRHAGALHPFVGVGRLLQLVKRDGFHATALCSMGLRTALPRSASSRAASLFGGAVSMTPRPWAAGLGVDHALVQRHVEYREAEFGERASIREQNLRRGPAKTFHQPTIHKNSRKNARKRAVFLDVIQMTDRGF